MRIGTVTGTDTQRSTGGSPQHRALAHQSLDALTASSSCSPARAAHLNSAAGSRSCCSCASPALLTFCLPASEYRAGPSPGGPQASALHLSVGQDSVRVGDLDCVGDAVPDCVRDGAQDCAHVWSGCDCVGDALPDCVRDGAQDCAHVWSGCAVAVIAPLASQGSCAFATLELLAARGIACCHQRFLRGSCPLWHLVDELHADSRGKSQRRKGRYRFVLTRVGLEFFAPVPSSISVNTHTHTHPRARAHTHTIDVLWTRTRYK